MDETIKTLKQLPFRQINPSKFMGINNQLPFNSIISQSKLLYFSGRSIILQNIKTHQQKIIWTNQYENQPQVFEHIRNAQRQNILGIVIRDNSQNHVILILHINSAINNYEHLDTKERSKDRMHYLKNLDHDDQVIELKFLQDGAMFATIVTLKNTQKQLSNKNIYIYKYSTGDCLYSCDFVAKNPLIEAVSLNRQSYVCIIRNQPEIEKSNSFFKLQNSFMKRKSNCNQQENKKSSFIINLLNLHDLQSKNQLLIQLEVGQSIIQVNFVENHKKMIVFFLLDSGFIISYVLNQRGFYQQLLIDVRISKIQHKKRVKQKMNQNNLLEKIQSCKEEFTMINKPQQRNFQRESKQVQFRQSFLEGKNVQKILKKKNPKQDKAQYYIPSCISCISNKVVIGYEECSFIGVIQYSGVDHRQYKYRYIDDFFIKRPQINSIRKISFAEDGCHCSVLVKVISAGKEYKEQESYNSRMFESKIQRKNQLSLPQHFNLLQIDFVSGMIQHSYHSQSIEQSLTCCSLHGDVECVEFVSKNNTMFVLIGDGRLCYCAMNVDKLGDNQGNSKNNNFVNNGNKKIDSKKLPKNDILSQSMLLWCENIRTKPYLILSHPIIFQVVLIYQDCAKFHFYNNQKLFQYHHALNLKNCKAASFSPYGDKLALGTSGSIWVMDSYTYTIVKKIPLVIFPTEVINKSPEPKIKKKSRRTPSVLTSHSTKTVSKIQYINNYDIIIQTGNTTLSILLNYQKVMYFGYTLQIIQGHLFSYDNKNHLGVIASLDCIKVIGKCSINSKNKCQQMAKIDVVITAIKLCGQIDVLFLGGKNGVLYFMRWPEFFQSEALKYSTLKNKLYLFHSAIVDIQISVNYKKLFVISDQGMMIICDLVHSDDAQKIGKDIYYRISKKIDIKMPFLNKWLVSTSETECHARHLTKLMGNEAEIKINQNIFTEQYKVKLQTQLEKQTEKLDQEFKKQLKKYEIDSGITKLQLDISLAYDQIKSIIGKRQAQSKFLNDKIDKDMHKIFKQKQKLQKEFDELKINCQQEKQTLLKDLQKELAQTDQNKQLKSEQIKKNQDESLNFYSQKMKINIDLQQNMKQDFEEDLNQAELFYGGQLKQILQRNNHLGQQNRRMKIQMIQTSQKMKQFSLKMEQLQSDVKDIEKQKQHLNQTKISFSQQIIQTDKKYHQLIKLTKQLQTILNKTRTSSQAYQLRFNQLEKDMQILQQKWDYLEQKADENGNNFVEQHNYRNVGTKQQQQLKQRIVKLKIKRKQLFQRQVLLKDLLKPFQKQAQQQQDQNLHFSNKNQSLEHKKSKTIKLTSDVNKWNNFKDQSKVKMIKNNQKLQQQTSKLMLRLNQMMKQHKELINKENNLKQAIKLQRQKMSLSFNKNNWEKFTFVTVPQEKQQDDSVNYRSHLSIYRQSLTKENKFNSTSYHFSSSHSLNRQKNNNRLSQKPLIFVKNKGQNLNNQDSSSSKLNKVSSKNLQALIYEKKNTFKQLKKQTSNNSLYHGVILDPKTLKPNKTLCISLHKEGSQSKFVADY